MIFSQADARRDAAESRKRASAVFIWGEIGGEPSSEYLEFSRRSRKLFSKPESARLPVERCLAGEADRSEPRLTEVLAVYPTKLPGA